MRCSMLTTLLENNTWVEYSWQSVLYNSSSHHSSFTFFNIFQRKINQNSVQFSQSLSHVRLFATPWIAALQASLSITNSRSSPKPMSIESVMQSSLCCPLLLLLSIFPSVRVFSNESTLHMRWPKYWSFSLSISPSNEHPGLVSFRMDWLDLQLGILKFWYDYKCICVYLQQEREVDGRFQVSKYQLSCFIMMQVELLAQNKLVSISNELTWSPFINTFRYFSHLQTKFRKVSIVIGGENEAWRA